MFCYDAVFRYFTVEMRLDESAGEKHITNRGLDDYLLRENGHEHQVYLSNKWDSIGRVMWFLVVVFFVALHSRNPVCVNLYMREWLRR